MFVPRRLAAVLLGSLLATVACDPAGPPPPEPSDEIQVTRIAFPEDSRVRGEYLMMNERGDVVIRPYTPEAFLWREGVVTRITPDTLPARARAVSDTGHVVGHVEGTPNLPFSWVDGSWELLPLGDAVGGLAFGVNDQGMVVGVLSGGSQYYELVAWDNGELIPAPDDVVVRDWPTGVNGRNQVAFTTESDGHDRAAIWDIDTGEVTELGTLGGDTSRATAINGRGMVTGTSATADGAEHAFLWRDGEMVDLGTLGGAESRAVDLNEWGQVTGTSEDADGVLQAFFWHDGEMVQIGSLGDPHQGPGTYGATVTSVPEAINNWGQVVGASHVADGEFQAFLWQNDRIVNLGELTASSDAPSGALDVNDRGEVVGFFQQDAAGDRAVLWTVSPLWGYPGGL